jgi:hypothetical protein
MQLQGKGKRTFLISLLRLELRYIKIEICSPSEKRQRMNDLCGKRELGDSERLVDFMIYFSADFSLCENSRIFFINLLAIDNIVWSTYTFSTYRNNWLARSEEKRWTAHIEINHKCQLEFRKGAEECLPDTFRQSQVAGKSAKQIYVSIQIFNF